MDGLPENSVGEFCWNNHGILCCLIENATLEPTGNPQLG